MKNTKELSLPNKQIEPLLSESSIALRDSESKQKLKLISDYLQKYAVIDGRGVNDEQIKVFYEALEHLDIRKLQKGLKRYLQRGKRWPWPGELVNWCEEEI